MCASPIPLQMPSEAVGVCQVACGGFHTAMVTLDGRVWSWGEGKYGQLGYASIGKSELPVEVKGLDRPCSYIACGRHHSLMADVDGRLWAWGHGKQGQLGDGERPVRKPTPRLIKCMFDGAGNVSEIGYNSLPPNRLCFKQVSCGARHSIALSEEGRVFTFGSGRQGQLGHGVLKDELYPRAIRCVYM